MKLHPWFEYFGMLQSYERNGLLQMEVGKHEAYVTQPAIHAMTPGDDPAAQLSDGSFNDTLRFLRAYAAFCSLEGEEYTRKPFAVHVVKPEQPHDLVYTVLLTPRKSWRTLGRWTDDIEVFDYGKGGRP